MQTAVHKAFTLIELMVVIAIVAVLTSVALASYRHANVTQYDTEAIATLNDFYVKVSNLMNDWGVGGNAQTGLANGCIQVDMRPGAAAPAASFLTDNLHPDRSVSDHWLYQICIGNTPENVPSFFITASRNVESNPGVRMHVISPALNAPLIGAVQADVDALDLRNTNWAMPVP